MIQNEPHYFHKKLINIFPLYSAYPWLLPVSLRQLNKLVSRLCSQLEKYGHVPGFIDLYLVNDKYIASANKEYLGCPGPTNILSFPGDSTVPGILLLSLDTFFRELKLFGQKQNDHLLSRHECRLPQSRATQCFRGFAACLALQSILCYNLCATKLAARPFRALRLAPGMGLTPLPG